MSKRKEIPDVMSQLQGLGSSPPPLPPQEEVQPTLSTPAQREVGRPKRPSKNRTPQSRLVGRATYDIGKDLKEVILAESIELGVPASQLAKR
jgi:hypothetical protein